jgi:transcriptional regulator with XRE-family HTH domain
MPRKPDQPQSPALERLKQLRGRLEVENPAFRVASQLERRVEAFCEAARDDLKARRKSLKWDQARLADALGYSQSAISKLESGHAELTLKSLYRMADALGLRPVIAFVPSARALTGGEIDEAAPENASMLEAARAVEEAQAAMIRNMPQAMTPVAGLAAVAKPDPQEEEAMVAALAMDAG